MLYNHCEIILKIYDLFLQFYNFRQHPQFTWYKYVLGIECEDSLDSQGRRKIDGWRNARDEFPVMRARDSLPRSPPGSTVLDNLISQARALRYIMRFLYRLHEYHHRVSTITTTVKAGTAATAITTTAIATTAISTTRNCNHASSLFSPLPPRRNGCRENYSR